MNIKRVLALLVTLVLGVTTFSYAGDIGQRIQHAYDQIEQGIQSGGISREEANRLKSDLRTIREDAQRLNKDLDRLEKHIYNARTHNDHGSFGVIRVVAGTYGQNCGVPYGNATSHLAAQCNGKNQCSYKVDYRIIGDPAIGCAKGYLAEWRCGNGPKKSAAAPGEAGFGAVLTLSCP